ncbi:MAG TPA: TetR/AcrR family transcriptional regulator [Anaerolineales bacterium]|nr:TetR/AcrR family transcriptional regulator [Anaerolineales bacterium]
MSRALTKLTIINAAAKLFARQGFEKTTVDEVAAEAGIAKGTVFYNFTTKDEIFLSVLQQGIDNLTELAREQSEHGTTPIEKMDSVYDATVEFLQKHAHFGYLLISELGRIYNRWNLDPLNLLEPYLQILGRILLEGQERRDFRRDISASEMAVIIFLGIAGSGLGRLMATGHHDLQLFTSTKKVLLSGLQADVASTGA